MSDLEFSRAAVGVNARTTQPPSVTTSGQQP